MTKADIIENVYEKVGGFSKKEAAEIVETVFDTIKETLERGEKIKISGFGNFVVRDKNARIGRNPQTGKEITISARRVLTFKPSQVLKNALNGEATDAAGLAAAEAADEADTDDDADDMDDEGAED
jgi:integration host factor subunit alpha